MAFLAARAFTTTITDVASDALPLLEQKHINWHVFRNTFSTLLA
jgi:hypothetical protein